MRTTYIILGLGYVLCLPMSSPRKREFSLEAVKEWKNAVKNNIAERLLRDPKVWDSVVEDPEDGDGSESEEEAGALNEGYLGSADVVGDREEENATEEFPLGRYTGNGRYNRGTGTRNAGGNL